MGTWKTRASAASVTGACVFAVVAGAGAVFAGDWWGQHHGPVVVQFINGPAGDSQAKQSHAGPVRARRSPALTKSAVPAEPESDVNKPNPQTSQVSPPPPRATARAAPTMAPCDSTMVQTAPAAVRIVCTSSPAAPSTPPPSTPPPSTPATSTPATSTPATSSPATSTPATSSPATSTPATSSPATSTPATSSPATSTPPTSSSAPSGSASTPASSAPASSAPSFSVPSSVPPTWGPPTWEPLASNTPEPTGPLPPVAPWSLASPGQARRRPTSRNGSAGRPQEGSTGSQQAPSSFHAPNRLETAGSTSPPNNGDP